MVAARAAQMRHWGLLFEGDMGPEYRESARRVGLCHHRIGLTPRWFLAGYGLVVSDLQRHLADHQAGLLFTAAARRDMAEIQRVLVCAVMLDMDLIIDSYREAVLNDRIHEAERAIRRIDEQVMDAIDGVGVYTDELVNSAEAMTATGKRVEDNADQASGSAGQALSSAQTMGRTLQAGLFDLSEDGALVFSHGDCKVGTPVEIHLQSDGITCKGEIVACGDHLHHIRFGQNLDTATVDRLARKYFPRVSELTKNDHVAFVQRIADAVAGKVSMNVGDLTTHHTCRLGRWYDTVADRVLVDLPSFRTLAPVHARVHDKGREVLQAHQAGDAEAAKRKLEELRELSRQVMAALDAMTAEMAAKG